MPIYHLVGLLNAGCEPCGQVVAGLMAIRKESDPLSHSRIGKAEHAAKHAPPRKTGLAKKGRIQRPCPDQYFTRKRV